LKALNVLKGDSEHFHHHVLDIFPSPELGRHESPHVIAELSNNVLRAQPYVDFLAPPFIGTQGTPRFRGFT